MYETHYTYSLHCNFCGKELKDDDSPFIGLNKARSVARDDYGWMHVGDNDVCRLCVYYAVEEAAEKREKEKVDQNG